MRARVLFGPRLLWRRDGRGDQRAVHIAPLGLPLNADSAVAPDVREFPVGEFLPISVPMGKFFFHPHPHQMSQERLSPHPHLRGELVTMGILMGHGYFIVIYKVCTSNFI